MMIRTAIPVALLLALPACSNEPDPTPEPDAGSTPDFTVSQDTAPPRAWTHVRVLDQTPIGQGLALDMVESCDAAGLQCVAMLFQSSSDDTLDYTGTTDGANSQDDTCTAATFTRLGGTGSFAVFATADGSPLVTGSKINVWTATPDCPLVEAGDKAFKVRVFDEDGETDADDCLGTCSAIVPFR